MAWTENQISGKYAYIRVNQWQKNGLFVERLESQKLKIIFIFILLEAAELSYY